MRPAIKIAISFAAFWIIIKLIFWKVGVFQDDITNTGLINNLMLLLSVTLGIYYEKRKEGFGAGTALSDIKNGMVAGAIYVVAVAGFIYFYYDTIHPEFIENKITERMDHFYIEMERDSYVDSLKLQSPELNVSTKEEIARAIKDDVVSNLSPRSIFFISLLGLMVLALTYAILITLIFQKILFKDHHDRRE